MDLDTHDPSFCSVRLMHVQSCLSFFSLFTETFSSCLLSGRAWCLAGCWCIACSWKFQPLNVRRHHSYPCPVSWFDRIDLQSQQKGATAVTCMKGNWQTDPEMVSIINSTAVENKQRCWLGPCPCVLQVNTSCTMFSDYCSCEVGIYSMALPVEIRVCGI